MTDVISTPLACKQPVYFSQTSVHGGNAASNNGLSSAGDISLRLASMATGAGILAASTAAVIQSGGVTGPDAALVAALAAGVGIGSLLLPRAKKGMALAIIAGLVCGEGFNLMSSAERIITRRDNAASSVNHDNSANQAAQDRLTAALKAQQDQRDQATEAVSMPSCAVQCRALLERQATDIAREVEEARREVGRVPAVRSAAPLAERLGWQPWALDLIAAVLLSVGTNGLSAVLIAFGGRPGTGGARHQPVAVHYARSAAVNVEALDLAAAPACPSIPALTDGTRQLSDGDNSEPTPPKPTGGLPAPRHPVSERTRGLLRLIEGSGGEVRGSQRSLADACGMSKGGLGRALDELRTAGVVDVVADRMSGTVVKLRVA
ncbi:MAG: hypothetical protein ABL901_00720 [Hyphomicrobiaceae bacterium]